MFSDPGVAFSSSRDRNGVDNAAGGDGNQGLVGGLLSVTLRTTVAAGCTSPAFSDDQTGVLALIK